VLAVLRDRADEDGTIPEMVVRHEHQHNETMLQTLQLARLTGYWLAGATSAPDAAGPAPTGLELIEVPAGSCTIGATASGFAYDNERPRHRTDVRGYLIGRTPITNATYLTFTEGGGYERREWWSDEGWHWKEQYDITRPGGWTADLAAEWRLGALEPLDPHRPVVHVSWFEADAFARAHGLRLPTEFEWEKAATWDQDAEQARAFPWGEDLPCAGVHANVDQLGCGPAAAGAYPAGASPYGCLGMIGDVWEWTSSPFDGYPGFTAHPYPEYSEVFFRGDYRVLRGGSWATRCRVATPTFRNWDHPQRRQIFSGFRIARDLR
jgi:iron(II)-dependent oxidoreductase